MGTLQQALQQTGIMPAQKMPIPPQMAGNGKTGGLDTPKAPKIADTGKKDGTDKEKKDWRVPNPTKTADTAKSGGLVIPKAAKKDVSSDMKPPIVAKKDGADTPKLIKTADMPPKKDVTAGAKLPEPSKTNGSDTPKAASVADNTKTAVSKLPEPPKTPAAPLKTADKPPIDKKDVADIPKPKAPPSFKLINGSEYAAELKKSKTKFLRFYSNEEGKTAALEIMGGKAVDTVDGNNTFIICLPTDEWADIDTALDGKGDAVYWMAETAGVKQYKEGGTELIAEKVKVIIEDYLGCIMQNAYCGTAINKISK